MFDAIKRLLNRMFGDSGEQYGILATRLDNGKKSAPATVAVVSSAGGTSLVAANGNRSAAIIQNLHATTKLYLGRDSTVTTGNGILVSPAGGIFIDQFSTDAWFGIQESGTGDARVIEVTR